MSRLLALAAVLLLLPSLLPAVAFASDVAPPRADHVVDSQEGEGESEAAETDGRSGLDDVVIWSLAALGIFAVVMGVLYFFKREVGGFPENPSWVAPITIMQSKDFADDGDFGDQAPSHQAHAEH